MNENQICQACGQPAAQTSIIGRTRICESCCPVVMAEVDALRADGKSVDVGRIAYAMRPPDPIQKVSTAGLLICFFHKKPLTGSANGAIIILRGRQNASPHNRRETDDHHQHNTERL